ncbi:hypothetical protein Ahy_A10g048588 [Arachis hypogaea]|uniref:Uncharacterized protein n=1 Tax=Arachis hypogaea TaxID=3818 RepID=A0A445B5F3_ARAHY|nr:hypothetical protein Ahy_A10g048588 [Arachis hypogaea]
MMEIGVDGDKDQHRFKRTFILYIQMSFLLPTTINNVSLVHMLPIFVWTPYVSGIGVAISSTFSSRAEVNTILGPPWFWHWTKELMLERIEAKTKDHMEKRTDIPEGGLHSTEAHYDSFQTHPPPQVTTALMMDVKAASFVKHDFSVPSFSLGFSESSQEDTLTQEGQPAVEKGKTQESPILVEELEDLVEQVINTRVAAALNFAKDKVPHTKRFSL